MKTGQIVALITLAVFAMVYLIVAHNDTTSAVANGADVPWGVRALSGGKSRVFGLTLGKARLDEAMARFGQEPRLALFDTPGKGMTLEVFYGEVTLGGLSGRIILSLAASPQALAAMRERASGKQSTDSGATRYALSAQDMRAARTLPLASLTYIPYVAFSAAMLARRFGPPSERLRTRDGLQHWLYPARGLDVILNPAGHDVFQYVAPTAFARLLAPLARALPSKSGTSDKMK